MDMITIEPVEMGGWFWLMLIAIPLIVGGGVLGPYAEDIGSRFLNFVAVVLFVAGILSVPFIPLGIHASVEASATERQNTSLEQQLGFSHVQRDGDTFVASQDGKFISGRLVDAGDNQYVVLLDDPDSSK